jgi:hypothetical protein
MAVQGMVHVELVGLVRTSWTCARLKLRLSIQCTALSSTGMVGRAVGSTVASVVLYWSTVLRKESQVLARRGCGVLHT